jgi:probable rRNA maturation factor
MAIDFNIEIGGFKLLNKTKRKAWLKSLSKLHGFAIEELSYTFLNDEALLAINIEHLKHDFYTDIITFDLGDGDNTINGDIYISVDRIRDNAEQRNINFEEELNRVLAHGVLHLIGFGDKTPKEETEMRNQENLALGLFHVEQSK